MGPIALFPKTVLSWNVFDPREITIESLSLYLSLEPKIGKSTVFNFIV